MLNKRNLITLFILLIGLSVVLVYFFAQEETIPEGEHRLAPYLPNEKGEGTVSGNEAENQVTEGEEVSTQIRQEIIEYTVANINKLSPVEPVLGGSWYVIRFWFFDDKDFYVEYEDGHILRQILLSKTDSEYKVVGYFEPGENGWDLIKGEDTLFGKKLDLYEYDEKVGKWTKRN